MYILFISKGVGMVADAAKGPRGRGRRPIAEVRAEVLAAAGKLLREEGYAGFALEKVAAISGASRVTLYRHWPSRGGLALDGYLHQVGNTIAFRDTGDIRGDLAAVLLGLVQLMEDEPTRRAFTQLIGAAQGDADLAASFKDHYFGPRRTEALALLRAAAGRGDLRSDADLPAVVDMLWGACYQRMLLPNLSGTLSAEFVHTVVNTVMSGIAPPAASSTTTGHPGKENQHD